MNARYRIVGVLCAAIGSMALYGSAIAAIQPEFEQRVADQFDYDNPTKTEITFLALARKASDGGDLDSACEYLAQAARAQGIKDELTKARTTLTRANSLCPNTAYARARLRLESGRIFRREKDLLRARLEFEAAYEIARGGGADSLAADSAHMLAIMLPSEDAGAWVDRGLVVAEASENPVARGWVGNLCFNWAQTLDDQGRSSEAALYLARSIAARRMQGDPSTVRAAEFAFAVELRKLDKGDQARAILSRLMREATKAGEPTDNIRAELKKLEPST